VRISGKSSKDLRGMVNDSPETKDSARDSSDEKSHDSDYMVGEDLTNSSSSEHKKEPTKSPYVSSLSSNTQTLLCSLLAEKGKGQKR
jgi:hypothetical protein